MFTQLIIDVTILSTVRCGFIGQMVPDGKSGEQTNNHCFSMVSAIVPVSRSLPLLELLPVFTSMTDYVWDM